METMTPNETKEAPKRRRMAPKAVLLIAAVLLVAALAVFVVIKVRIWKNDGARYAERLSEQIGVTPETAQRYAHITFRNASRFACVNSAAEAYKFLYESDETVLVDGVTIPQWVIYVGERDNTVTDIQYYNYAQLQKYGNGVKTAAHVEPSGIVAGLDQAAVQSYTGFAPLRIAYTNKGMQELYQYYYTDAESGNTLGYYLYVEYVDRVVVSANETEHPFMVEALMPN